MTEDRKDRFELGENDFNETSLTDGFEDLGAEDEVVEEIIAEEVSEEPTEKEHNDDEINFEEIGEDEAPKKKSGKRGNKTVLVTVGFVVFLLGVVGWLVLSVYSDMQKEIAENRPVQTQAYANEVQTQSPSATPENLASTYLAQDKEKLPPKTLNEEYSVPQAETEPQNAYGVPELASNEQTGVNTKNNAWDTNTKVKENIVKSEYKEEFYGETTDSTSVSAVESEMMGISTKNGNFESNQGGVCDLSVKFKPSIEYVYYVLEGNNYVPVFKKKDWDGKGIIVDQRVVTLSYDNINKFTEIEKGKFIPSEMFSKCSAFDKN